MRIESNSSLNTALSCFKKYEYRYIKRLETMAYNSARSFGSFVHYFKECEHKGVEPNRDGIIGETLKAFPGYKEEISLDAWLAERVAYQHTRYWNNVGGTLGSLGNDAIEFKDVEAEWLFWLDKENAMAGKRDGLIRLKEYEKDLLYEIKTSSAKEKEKYLHRLSLDSQPSANIIALKNEKKPVEGVLYDIIWKPMIRRKTGRKTMPDETMQEFYQRKAEEYATEPAKYFHRELVLKPEADLGAAYEDIVGKFALLNAATNYPRNTQACENYNTLCPYFDMCMQPSIEDNFLSGYKVRDKHLPELTKEIQEGNTNG